MEKYIHKSLPKPFKASPAPSKPPQAPPKEGVFGYKKPPQPPQEDFFIHISANGNAAEARRAEKTTGRGVNPCK